MPKATKAQTAQRQRQVEAMILRGASLADIIAHAEKNKWNLQVRQIRTYMRRARLNIQAEAQTDRADQLALARARLNMLFAGALILKDFKTALSVQKEINALEALYAPPAEQTIRILGIQDEQARQLAALLADQGMNASDLFDNLIKRVAAQNTDPEKAKGKPQP